MLESPTISRLRILSVPIVAALSLQLGCASGGETAAEDPFVAAGGGAAGDAGSSGGGGEGGDSGSGTGGTGAGGSGGDSGSGAGGTGAGGTGAGGTGAGGTGAGGTGAGGTGAGGTGGGTTEFCNGLDDDGDDDVDEDDPEGGAPCTVPDQLGICALGTEHCVEGELACVADYEAEDEICNGDDDDCDGDTDEDSPGGNEACDTALDGACSVGVTGCDENGDIVCLPIVEPGDRIETCNNVDDDCDGPADEDNPGGGETCSVAGEKGECAKGVTDCTDGAIMCTQVNFSKEEICDDADNDCDGDVDEAPMAGIGNDCNVPGKEGICVFGTMTCRFGNEECEQRFAAGTEICDGDDNDCDGSIDEPPMPNMLAQCPINALGQCALGEYHCINGNKTCVALFDSSTEVCDGVDNDCDGAEDELPMPGVETDCTVAGAKGVCAIGKTTCRGGGINCTAQNVASLEVCDGVDNDCNGSKDELPMPGIDEACTVPNAKGICAVGLTICSDGQASCSPVNSPLPQELCNDIDDDCDGQKDEDDPWIMCQANCGGTGTFDRIATLACDGTCKATACEDGYIDANFDACDGCETFTCVSSTSTCNAPHALAVDSTFAGTLRATNEEAWIEVDFSQLFASSAPTYKIKLVNGSGNGYVMDVLDSCTTTAYTACGTGSGSTGSGNGSNILEWDVDYSSVRAGYIPCGGTNGKCEHNSSSIVDNSKFIRIRRNSVASGQECVQFQVEFQKL